MAKKKHQIINKIKSFGFSDKRLSKLTKLKEEVKIAKMRWNFDFVLKNSLSDPRGNIILINEFMKK